MVKTMIIISDYTLVLKEDFGVLLRAVRTPIFVPYVGERSATEIPDLASEKGKAALREQLMIRRFRCQNCHAYHNELPDCRVPYKHYEAEVIAGVLDEVILPDDLDSEDYPSFNTMLRWLQWFVKTYSVWKDTCGQLDTRY